MANRRSLSTALEMSSEQRAFIDGSTATQLADPPQPEQRELSEPPPSPQKSAVAQNRLNNHTGSDLQPEPSRLPASPPQTRKRTEKLLRDDGSIVWISQMLVPLTTRLQPTTAAALKRAGLEQKLRGQRPGTVQEIAEAALQGWLKEYGYLE